MERKRIYTSKTISRLMAIPYAEEPGMRESIREADSGVFIGSSSKMNMPIFIDFNALFNPHIFIVGMTGSGKTYLMKSLLVRLSFILEASVVMIDLTGEYLELAKMIGAEMHTKRRKLIGLNLDSTSYFMLKGLKEKEKAAYASEILKAVALKMRGNLSDNKKRTFVLLDESWKLIENNEDLEVIVREGRKYGVGLILASQMLEDMSDKIVSNSASIFIFRVQMQRSAEKILADYDLSREYLGTIQAVGQGRCLLIKLDKNNRRSTILINRIIGISLSQKTRLILG